VEDQLAAAAFGVQLLLQAFEVDTPLMQVPHRFDEVGAPPRSLRFCCLKEIRTSFRRTSCRCKAKGIAGQTSGRCSSDGQRTVLKV
jgi:hypothetical protein